MKKVTPINKAAVNGRVAYMSHKFLEYKRNTDGLHVCISEGNRKTGILVPSISLRPILDCVNCSQCKLLCYDVRNDCRHKVVMDSRARNAAILKTDPEKYFAEIHAFLTYREMILPNSAFRWHVGGDIVNAEYFEEMVKMAGMHPTLKFLAFTKAYDVVNQYMDVHGDIPENLSILFSIWEGLECNNPYEFPTSHVRYSDGRTTAPDDAIECSGNCSECLVTDLKCFGLKRGIPGVSHGEAMVLNIH